MLKTDPITQKIISRLDKIDRQVLEQHLSELAKTTSVCREMLQELSEGVLLLDSAKALLFINARGLDLLGLASGSDRVLKKWLESLPDPSLAAFITGHAGCSRGKTVEDISVMHPREMHLRFSFVPLAQEENRYTVILIQDRTGEQTQRLERERLTRMEDLMNLTAGIAHEIGNPLNALSIHLQLLKKETHTLSAKPKKAFENRLGVMESEIQRLDQIIRNFLKATRRPPLRFAEDNLNVLIREVLDVMAPEAGRQKVKLEFEEDKKLPVFLMDRLRLYQALMNLVKNGLEAMPKGGRLVIRLSHRERVAAIRIEDAGSGISEEHLPHIFDAFYTTKEKGTGLGLVAVFQAVSEHGGKIDVSSKAGKGSVFTIYLPLRAAKLQLPKS